MKLKLFNGSLTSMTLSVVSGGYDPEHGHVVVMVRGEGDQAGTLQLSVTEAGRMLAILSANLPEVKKVEAKPEVK